MAVDDTNGWVINEHTAMVEKIKQSKVFQCRAGQQSLQNLANYFVRIPSEVGMLLWSAMGEGEQAQTNIVHFHDVKATDADGNTVSVQQHNVSVLTAEIQLGPINRVSRGSLPTTPRGVHEDTIKHRYGGRCIRLLTHSNAKEASLNTIKLELKLDNQGLADLLQSILIKGFCNPGR